MCDQQSLRSACAYQARRKQLQIGGAHINLMGGHRYENFRAQMRNLLRLRYEKDGGQDMEIIWRTHVETMRGGGGILRGMEVKITGMIHRLIFKKKKN